MTKDDLWALFRSWLDDIDAGVKTSSEVRKLMMKVKVEELELPSDSSTLSPRTAD